jgi:hypothetical protein
MPGAGCEIGIFLSYSLCRLLWYFCLGTFLPPDRAAGKPRLHPEGAALFGGVSKDGRTSDHPSRLAQERARTSSDNGEAVAQG